MEPDERTLAEQAATLWNQLVEAAEAYVRFAIAAHRFLPFVVERLAKRKAAAKAVLAERSEKGNPQKRGASLN